MAKRDPIRIRVIYCGEAELVPTPSSRRIMTILEAIEIRHCRLPLFNFHAKVYEDSVRIYFGLLTFDRVDGSHSYIIQSESVSRQYFKTMSDSDVADFFLRLIRSSISKVIAHERDECIYFLGTRPVDPHKDEAPSPPEESPAPVQPPRES
jgi:hypothetical protein